MILVPLAQLLLLLVSLPLRVPLLLNDGCLLPLLVLLIMLLQLNPDMTRNCEQQ